MRRKMDLTGQRYGRLVVLKEVETKDSTNDRWWLCQCDCGTLKEIRMGQLRTGKTTSCGCYQKEKSSAANTRDLTGQKFGRLLVVENAESSKKGNARWVCKCDCGNTGIVLAQNLKSGATTSCGCRRTESGYELQVHLEKYRKDGIRIPALKRRRNANNTSGIKGVSVVRSKTDKKYKAEIAIKNQKIYLGTFETKQRAAEARQKAEEKYHKPILDDETAD